MSERYLYQCVAKGCNHVYDSAGRASLHLDAYPSHSFKIVIAQ